MLFSIIIPIYNRAHTLPKCLDSIIVQEFEDFECILIDDGSKDNSLEVCKEYAVKDSRFKVFHKQNGGVSTARNLGLEKAKGEWIVFVDSDDRILSNHLAQFKNMFDQNKDIDIVFCGLQYEGGINHPAHTYKQNVFIGKEQIKKMFAETDVLQYMCACDRSYRKKIVDKYLIRFDTSLPISEDRLFCYKVLKYVSGTAMSAYATYVINESDNNSLSRRILASDICVNRYCKLSIGMKELIEEYQIFDDKIISFWTYNFDILKQAIQSFYNVKGSIFDAAQSQRKFMQQYFDFVFYKKIRTIPAVEEYMSNQYSRWIMNSQFIRYNLNIFYRFVLYKLHILK